MKMNKKRRNTLHDTTFVFTIWNDESINFNINYDWHYDKSIQMMIANVNRYRTHIFLVPPRAKPRMNFKTTKRTHETKKLIEMWWIFLLFAHFWSSCLLVTICFLLIHFRLRSKNINFQFEIPRTNKYCMLWCEQTTQTEIKTYSVRHKWFSWMHQKSTKPTFDYTNILRTKRHMHCRSLTPSTADKTKQKFTFFG